MAVGEEESPNRFGIGMRLGFNINAKFSGLGGYTSMASPGPATGGGVDRTYDDGFVKVDASGNQGGSTWNWGYNSPAQAPGNDTLQFHAATADANLSVDANDDPQWGMEVFYQRRLGKQSWGTWGIEGAFGYTDLSIQDHSLVLGQAGVITDTYALGGLVVPPAPYAGSYAGPGMLLGDTPTRSQSIDPAGEQVMGSRELDGTLYCLRVGPYARFALVKRLSLQLGAGLAVGIVDSEFRFTETVSSATATLASRSGADSKTDVLAGAYVDARFAYRLCSCAEVFVGAQYQYLPDFEQQAAGKKAHLDLGETAFVNAGFAVEF